MRRTYTSWASGALLLVAGESSHRRCAQAHQGRGRCTGFALVALLLDATVGAAQVWSPTGTMSTPRLHHAAVRLMDGSVLVSGGLNGPLAYQESAEIYSVTTGAWTPTGHMGTARAQHTATLLLSGLVLVVGGRGSDDNPTSSAELFDPAAGTWTPTGFLQLQRTLHAAVLLPNGKVLIAGGLNATSPAQPTATAETFDPSTGLFTTSNDMSAPRENPGAALLADGRVLLAGGRDVQSAEVFDPATGLWTSVGSLAQSRPAPAVRLLSGAVLVSGGGNDYPPLSLCELFDPVSQMFAATGSLNIARLGHTTTLLLGGEVLAAGGNTTDGVALSSAELYESATGMWMVTSPMTEARVDSTATLLADGRVLVAGGVSSSSYRASAELYGPAATNTPTPTPADTSTLAPTPTNTATRTPTGTPSPTFTPACIGAPSGTACDDGLFCNGTDTCDGAGSCGLHSGACDDGDPCTADTCDEATRCHHVVVVESRACNDCEDGVDNDSDNETDADDSDCATLSEYQHFALIARSTKGKSLTLGTQVWGYSAPGSVPLSTAPFPLGPSRAGVCGERQVIGAVAQIPGSLAGANNQKITFGTGDKTNIGAYYAVAPMTTTILTGVAPIVGPGNCTDAGVAACTQIYHCTDPATCDGGRLNGSANPYVDKTGTHEEFVHCTSAKSAMVEDEAYLYGRPVSDPAYNLGPIDYRISAPQPLPTLTGPGPHVLRLSKLRVLGGATLVVSANDSEAAVVIQVDKSFVVAKTANVSVGGSLKARNLLWVLHGKGSAKINGSGSFVGTILAPERSVKVGQNVHLDGGIIANKIKINGLTTVTHLPFTPLL